MTLRTLVGAAFGLSTLQLSSVQSGKGTKMDTARVRYIVNNIDQAVSFYTKYLGFQEKPRPTPNFAMLSRDALELVLSTPFGPGGVAKPMSDGGKAEPGGWNRIIITVDDLRAEVAQLRKANLHFRNEIVSGPGGSEILLDDPSGNPVELFQPSQSCTRTHAEAKITVRSSDAKPYDQAAKPELMEVHLSETFSGDIDGESPVRALEVQRDDHSASLVSVQRFRGKLGGRPGTFVLQGRKPLRTVRSGRRGLLFPGRGQAVFPDCAARAALKATLGKGLTERSITGSSDTALAALFAEERESVSI